MTLPKTHPLYGAHQCLAREECMAEMGVGNLCESNGTGACQSCQNVAGKRIRALESAGYRVVGPEPTEAELVAGLRAGNPLGELVDWQRQGFDDSTNTREEMAQVLRAAHAAAPTVTETKKGS